MADTIVFSRVMQGELPFTLNLPEGIYKLIIDGGEYKIHLLQKRIAVPTGANAAVVGVAEDLKLKFGQDWESLFKIQMRTIVKKNDDVGLPYGDLKEANESQLLEAAKTAILKNDLDNRPSNPQQLEIEAQAQLDQLNTEDKKAFAFDAAVRLACREIFPAREIQAFCKATNAIIRLYMATFNDFFVQEITENFFSGTTFHGVLVETFCNGQPLENTRHVGGLFPYITRSPWLEHPQPAVDAFRVALENATEPDPVKLLNVRARSLLKRGGFRSALIEASAAFDLCLKRKIRSGFTAKGKTDSEIDTILSDNPRYLERAKKILKEATGHSAADLAPAIWQRFVAHRTERGKVAHAATEPSESEATSSVEDMVTLSELIDGLVT